MEEKRKRGRPCRWGERSSFSARMTLELRAKLQESAQSAGRSLSEEVEHRLQASFNREAMLDDLRRVLREERTDGTAAPLTGEEFMWLLHQSH